jgi:hypothetical protein
VHGILAPSLKKYLACLKNRLSCKIQGTFFKKKDIKEQGTMSGNRIKYLVTAIMLLGFYTQLLKADTAYLEILSPKPNTTVKDGEVFIAIQLKDSVTFKKASVVLWLDGFIVNFQAKITDKKVTLLYLTHLKPGTHHVKLNAKASDGSILEPLEWDFNIQGAETAEEKKKVKNFDILGFVNLYSRFDTITGPGKGLRQEPRNTNEIGFSIEPRYKSISFPISGFFTSNDQATLQPRNKFRLGFKSTYLEAYYGDHFPMYDQFVVNGIRVHGYEAIFKLRKISLSFVQGDLTRAVDGQLLKVRKDTAFLPYNLRRDSFYVTPGIFKRTVLAGRLSVGKEEEGSMFGITILRSMDDTNSIHFGSAPKQNLAAGIDQTLISQNGIFKESAGIAISLTTNDYSRPALTDTGIYNTYKIDVPLNPAFFKGLIIINPTSDPLLIQKRASESYYVKMQLKLGFNRLNVDYRRIGPSFYSFGNPFLRNDIEEISAGDYMSFWKRRINLRLKYLTNTNNLYNQLTSTIHNNYYISTLSFAPGPKWPQIFGGYRDNQRISTGVLNEFANERSLNVRDDLFSYNAGIAYRLKTGRVINSVTATYSNSERVSSSMPDNSTKSNVVFASFQQDYFSIVGINLQYSNYNTISAQSGTIQNLNSYGANLSFSIKKKATISAGYNTNQNLATLISTASARNTYLLQYRQDITKHLNFSLEVGHADYTDTNPNNRYNEWYSYGGLNYIF